MRYVNGNLHLNYNFGWKPFISDVKKAFRGVTTFEERLTKFVARQNKDISRKASKGPFDTSTESTWTLPYRSNPTIKALTKVTVKTVHSAAFRFGYAIPDYSEKELRWRSMLDTLGLDVNPANIWAVIPWSFVVDWFAGVGGALDTLSSDWVEPFINVIQAYTSTKWEYELTLRLDPNGGGYWGDIMNVVTLKGSKYTRLLGMPKYQMVYPDLNADKIRLLASLAVSRIV